jgi:hypothetical protein
MVIVAMIVGLFVGVFFGVFIVGLCRMAAEPTPSWEPTQQESVPLDDGTYIRRAYFN